MGKQLKRVWHDGIGGESRKTVMNVAFGRYRKKEKESSKCQVGEQSSNEWRQSDAN